MVILIIEQKVILYLITVYIFIDFSHDVAIVNPFGTALKSFICKYSIHYIQCIHCFHSIVLFLVAQIVASNKAVSFQRRYNYFVYVTLGVYVVVLCCS